MAVASAEPSSSDAIQEAVLNSDEGSNWRLRRRTNRGSHGEVWRGTRVEDDNDVVFDQNDDWDLATGSSQQGQPHRRRGSGRGPAATTYVLKRMLLEKGEDVARAAAREIFFGEKFRNISSRAGNLLSRYVESFTVSAYMSAPLSWSPRPTKMRIRTLITFPLPVIDSSCQDCNRRAVARLHRRGAQHTFLDVHPS